MSSTVRAPYIDLGPGGDYPVEMNYAIRIYTNPPQNEKIPAIGEEGATLKGGQRTNFHGLTPILDGDKKLVGWAEVTRIVSARLEFMPIEEVMDCGFKDLSEAMDYVKREHREEFEKDGVMTVFHYRVEKLNEK